MKPIDVKPDSHAAYSVESNLKKVLKRIPKYKKNFAKGCAPNLLRSFCDQQN